jgi:hypothetical protein
MKQKELVALSVGIFLTMIAFAINSIYHIQQEPQINREIKPVEVHKINIDPNIFSILKDKN